MAYPNIFEESTTTELDKRIDELTPSTQRLWGKMGVAEMLAHCCIPYEQVLGERNDKTPFLMKWIVKTFFKSSMVNEVPYKKNLPTPPAFIIKEEKNFEWEKQRLKHYVRKIQVMGPAAIEGKEQSSIGKLTSQEWNNLLYKHLDHHLKQFGV
jgi:hypothetical protein